LGLTVTTYFYYFFIARCKLDNTNYYYFYVNGNIAKTGCTYEHHVFSLNLSKVKSDPKQIFP